MTTSSTSESALNQISALLTTNPNPQLGPTPTPCRAKKRNAEQDEPDIDEMIKTYIKNKTENRINNYDSVDYLFLSYAQTFKKLLSGPKNSQSDSLLFFSPKDAHHKDEVRVDVKQKLHQQQIHKVTLSF